MPNNPGPLLKLRISINHITAVLLLYCCSACLHTDTVQNLKGVWVNKVYADSLLLTHSPRASQEAGGITYLYFTDDTAQSVLVVYGLHEGNTWSVIRDSKKILLYDSGEKSNIGTIEPISTQEFRLGHQDFIKLKHPNRNNYDDDVVEELLFAGNYRLQNGSSVTLSPDGLASGWDTIRYFKPDVDYIGPGMDVDQIELGSNKDKLTSYGFKFAKDTLIIYKLNCLISDSLQHECDSVAFGEVAWKLVKKQ